MQLILPENEERTDMGIYLNPGNEQFAVSVNSELYVNKTEFYKICEQPYWKRQTAYLFEQAKKIWKNNGCNHACGILQQRMPF